MYITKQGAIIRRAGERLIVSHGRETVADVPVLHVSAILLFGNVQITTQAMALLSGHGVGVAFLSMGGRLWGSLAPVQSRNVFLRLAQHERHREPQFALAWGKALVGAKLKAQLALLRDFRRNHPEAGLGETVDALSKIEKTIEAAPDLESLRGVEGAAGMTYFGAFPEMLRGGLPFHGRTQHPPRDPVNALLSFAYVLTTNELGSLCEAQGLDPYLGFLHGLRYGRESLACDLVEPLRPALCDRFVLSLVNRRQMTASSFQDMGHKAGVHLTDTALKSFLEAWEGTLEGSGTSAREPAWRKRMGDFVAVAVRSIFRGQVPTSTSLDGPATWVPP